MTAASHPPSVDLAEFSFGLLGHDWDAPEMADFVAGPDLVNGLAARAEGFGAEGCFWRMDDDAMEALQADPDGPCAGDPRMASTLSVWRDIASLEAFVWKTVRRPDLAEAPDLAERKGRWRHRRDHGDSDLAFGWSYRNEAQAWKTHGCGRIAAE
ncbi:DUF3291 domain-containing protein [Pseudogemmobacter sonorensis]|uniref:DUF3291 domain-containing protein n=1 Tax=Pseudogemmobacter sonorensis TaxID=2989681 RepID=UPI00367FE16C